MNMTMQQSLRTTAISDADLNQHQIALPKDFSEISVKHDPNHQIFWCYMDQKGRPSYTYALGEEMAQVHEHLAHNSNNLRYFVCASKTPGTYNLGGDLKHFAKCIEDQDIAAMRHYAKTCTEMQYAHHTAFGAPIITIALVQGTALGGGFEHALAFDLLIAERSSKLGLPEVGFNLFPGMGAYSFLLRRVGRKITEQMILGGKIYSAAELHDMGVVDILLEDGEGEDFIHQYAERYKHRFHAERAIYNARRIANPVTLDELMEITNLWAETAMRLTSDDVRKMIRLANAQERRSLSQKA